MARKDAQTESIKDLVEKRMLEMLANPETYPPSGVKALTLAVKYLQVKVALEDDYGKGFASLIGADGPGEGEFDPPLNSESGPSLLTQLEAETSNG